ncbi:MAG: signal peptidase II [Erysipelotrichaceae bacterium]|nr:signal peptidase II [Erysipelotrichaceae bacterium]MDY5252340.1 signal peptidase II [Erysipelotrichaceae bacterium]
MKLKLAILSVAIIVIDQLTKYYFQINLALHDSIPVIKDFFYLTYAKNTGAGWSMFSGHTEILAFISLAMAGCFIYLYIKEAKENHLQLWCYSLLIAGALGNLIDRLYLGYVRDFLDFYLFGYDFPIFNVADIAVTFGAFILIYIFVKEEYGTWKK